MSGPHDVQIRFKKEGTVVCTAPEREVTVGAGGGFAAPVDISGCAGLFDGSEVRWSARVDGTELSR
jgi:hypothetical protein